MDIAKRPVRRAMHRIVAVTQLDAENFVQEKTSEVEDEQPRELFENSAIETHDVINSGSSLGPRGRGVRMNYDRNAHRHLDEKRYHRKRRQMHYALPAGAFLVVAAVMLWGPFTPQPKILSAQQANVVDRVEPDVIPLAGSSDEKPAPDYLETHIVSANRPRLLTIRSLDVRARVFEVGSDGRSQPQLPKNSYDAGWYNVSVKPGESGAVVLSGACSGSVGQGVFHRLGELSNGARIEIENGDRTSATYSVQSVVTVNVENLDMADTLRPRHGYEQGLSLVGCTGSYDIKTNDFAGRVIVRAVPI